MKDRFKFRCGRTISHYDKDGNDVDTFLFIDNVTVLSDGTVGVSEYQIKNAIKKINLDDEKEKTLWERIDDETFPDCYSLIPDFIEQCTGLEDKNGKLIYEGDIIKRESKKNIQEVVFWCDELACFRLMSLDFVKIIGFSKDIGLSYKFIAIDDIEVIGNIHENPELVNNKIMEALK